MVLVLIACGENVKQQAYAIPSDIGYPVISRGDDADFPDIAPSLRTER